MAAAKPSSRGTVEKESVVREHHVYRAIWTPVIREELLTRDPAYIRARPYFRNTRFRPGFYSDKYGTCENINNLTTFVL